MSGCGDLHSALLYLPLGQAAISSSSAPGFCYFKHTPPSAIPQLSDTPIIRYPIAVPQAPRSLLLFAELLPPGWGRARADQQHRSPASSRAELSSRPCGIDTRMASWGEICGFPVPQAAGAGRAPQALGVSPLPLPSPGKAGGLR